MKTESHDSKVAPLCKASESYESMGIPIATVVSSADLRRCCHTLFPGARVCAETEWTRFDQPSEIFIVLSVTDSEFPSGLVVGARLKPETDQEAWLRGLARALSTYFGARTIIGGGPDEELPRPYWMLVWERNAVYLADDQLMDDGKGTLRKVRKLELTSVRHLAPDELSERLQPASRQRDPGKTI